MISWYIVGEHYINTNYIIRLEILKSKTPACGIFLLEPKSHPHADMTVVRIAAPCSVIAEQITIAERKYQITN